MKRYFVLIFLLLSGLSTSAAGFSIESGTGIEYNVPEGTNGNVFIFSGESAIKIKFSADDSTGFSWFEYKQDPKEAVSLVENTDFSIAKDGKSSILHNVDVNYGYYIEYEYNGHKEKKYVWIALYDTINAVTLEEVDTCKNISLRIVPPYKEEYVFADSFGRRETGTIERELKIEYLTWKSPGIEGDTTITDKFDDRAEFTVPYANTDITVTDLLGEKLKLNIKPYIIPYKTSAVIAFPAMSTRDIEKNEVDSVAFSADEFGNVKIYFSETPFEGNADCPEFRSSASSIFDNAGNVNPFSVDFTCNANPDVADWYEWRISHEDKGFTDITYSGGEELSSFTYNYFPKSGKYDISLTVFNRDSLGNKLCSYTAYTCLNISTSAIFVPNAFTPDGDGINERFKVAYTSITSFRCQIFNQAGRRVYESTDINEGWNGKIRLLLGGESDAPTGVYFYVIDAKGTNGKALPTKKGTLNLLRSK